MAYEMSRKENKKAEKLILTDDDFLSIVQTERRNAIGIELGDEVTEDRITAMEYFKGKMDDVVALPGRSNVVSTDIADAIYTVLPDLVEIFIGGEDIGSFTPVGPEDVEPAKQETEVVNQVIMGENDGFGLVYDAIHNALLNKVGIFNFWVEENEAYTEQTLNGLDAPSLEALMQDPASEVYNVQIVGVDEETGEPYYSAEVRKSEKNPCFMVKAVAPERFAVARDTSDLRDATYCVMETTPRAQELKAQGFDPDIVDDLPGFQIVVQQESDRARDTAGESNQPYGGAGDALYDLRLVKVYQHIIRVDADGDGKPEIWRVDTDEQESVILQKVKLNRIPFSMGSPYRQPHRAYGRSVADLLMEIQRIKTALTRAAMDARYFSLNQRHEVADQGSNEHTISDLLNNTPGYPVRVKTIGTVNALNQKGFDGMDFEALEYWNTETEKRTGIVRNAQGLNPDTLHDTARGAEALMSRAQVRTRMIARTLGETLFKDLFLGVHGLMRDHGSKQKTVELRSGWTQVNPTDWGARKDMRVTIGLGGGKEHDLMVLSMVGDKMAQTIEGQASGAIPVPVVNPENVFNYLEDFAERAGSKSRARYFTDPKPAQEAAANQPPPPDPEMMKLEAEMQAKQMEMQAQAEMKQAEMAMQERHTQMQFDKDMQLAEAQQRDDMARAQIEAQDKERAHQLAVEKARQDAIAAERKAYLEERKLELEAEKLALERERMALDSAAKAADIEAKAREHALREREIAQGAEIENARLSDAKEARSVDFETKRMERESKASEAKEPKEEKPDRSGEAIGKGLEALAEGMKAMNKPKRVKRNKDGQIEGIE